MPHRSTAHAVTLEDLQPSGAARVAANLTIPPVDLADLSDRLGSAVNSDTTLIFDIRGTIATGPGESQFPETTRNEYRQAIYSGRPVVFLTGEPWPAAREILVDALGLDSKHPYTFYVVTGYSHQLHCIRHDAPPQVIAQGPEIEPPLRARYAQAALDTIGGVLGRAIELEPAESAAFSAGGCFSILLEGPRVEGLPGAVRIEVAPNKISVYFPDFADREVPQAANELLGKVAAAFAEIDASGPNAPKVEQGRFNVDVALGDKGIGLSMVWRHLAEILEGRDAVLVGDARNDKAFLSSNVPTRGSVRRIFVGDDPALAAEIFHQVPAEEAIFLAGSFTRGGLAVVSLMNCTNPPLERDAMQDPLVRLVTPDTGTAIFGYRSHSAVSVSGVPLDPDGFCQDTGKRETYWAEDNLAVVRSLPASYTADFLGRTFPHQYAYIDVDAVARRNGRSLVLPADDTLPGRKVAMILKQPGEEVHLTLLPMQFGRFVRELARRRADPTLPDRLTAKASELITGVKLFGPPALMVKCAPVGGMDLGVFSPFDGSISTPGQRIATAWSVTLVCPAQARGLDRFLQFVRGEFGADGLALLHEYGLSLDQLNLTHVTVGRASPLDFGKPMGRGAQLIAECFGPIESDDLVPISFGSESVLWMKDVVVGLGTINAGSPIPEGQLSPPLVAGLKQAKLVSVFDVAIWGEPLPNGVTKVSGTTTAYALTDAGATLLSNSTKFGIVSLSRPFLPNAAQ